MVDYIEAKYELGEFNQDIANKTINKLRERGHVGVLTVNNIPSDLKRDPSVNPVFGK